MSLENKLRTFFLAASLAFSSLTVYSCQAENDSYSSSQPNSSEPKCKSGRLWNGEECIRVEDSAYDKPQDTGIHYDRFDTSPPEDVYTPPLCQNECAFVSEKECFGNGYKTCGNHNQDDCLEWSTLYRCNSEAYCQNGECQTINLSNSVFFDNFNGHTLDQTKWEIWSDDFTYTGYSVEEGILNIFDTGDNLTNEIYFVSREMFDFHRGMVFEVEARIKLDTNESSISVFLGEIFYVCEVREDKDYGDSCVCGELGHTWTDCENYPQDISGWHTYRLTATQQTIEFHIDNQLVLHLDDRFRHIGTERVVIRANVYNRIGSCLIDYVNASLRDES